MHLYLYKRHLTYYYRIKIPADIRPSFNGKEHIVKSLKTKDLSAAKVYASALNAKVQHSFALLRTEEILVTHHGVEKPQPREQKEPSGLLLSNLIYRYVEEKASNWTSRTTDDFKGKFSLLVRIIGDLPINDISRKTCVDCRNILVKLPANFSKKKDLKSKTIKELIKVDNLPKISAKTVNMYIIQLSSVFKWAVKYGYLELNPAEGLQVENKVRKNEERKAYSEQDIMKIFDALPYSKASPEDYWLPRIARYSGMRLEEIAQLHRDDIRIVNRVHCFDVNNDKDKKLKTLSSKRLVPIHPWLISKGFLDYVQSAKGQRLWTNLSPDKYGRYGKLYGNRYGRLNKKLISDTKKCFHSFRHTVADGLKQSGVSDTLIIELLGHEDPKISTGRYGKMFKPEVLLDAIKKL